MSRAQFRSMTFCVLLPLLALVLSACSKTVQWEEEVPLNTGETIWVKRTVKYVLQGDAGNPLDMAYRPNWSQRFEFTWNKKNYIYEGEAQVFVLAISPHRLPILVARASDKSWDIQNNYRCTKPSYVQLIPGTDGHAWSWPPAIEPWLYELPANLMLALKKPEEMKRRYLSQDRATQDAIVRAQSPSLSRVDSTFVTNDCKGKI